MGLLPLASALALGVSACAGTGRPSLPSRTGVFVANVGSGTLTRVATRPGFVQWSNDRRRLLVVSFDGRRLDVLTPTGQTRLHLNLDAAYTGQSDGVALAPRGARIAYIAAPRDSRQPNFGDLVVSSLTRRRPRRILTRALGTPAWSPDGQRLAVLQASVRQTLGGPGGAPPRLLVVRADGRGTAEVVATGAADGADPQWLGDGRLLVQLESKQPERGDDLFAVAVRGGHRTLLARDVRSGQWDPAPDDRRLAVAGAIEGDGYPHLAVVSTEHDRPHRIIPDIVAEVRWSPRGDQLAVVIGERIVLMHPDGTHARTVVHIRAREISQLAWSSDARRIAFAAAPPPPPED